jgi:hypothetical protein
VILVRRNDAVGTRLYVPGPLQWRDAMSDDLETQFLVICPYCGEQVEIYIEPDVLGTLVQDCEVCCQPWSVRVDYDQGQRYIDVSRGDGSE